MANPMRYMIQIVVQFRFQVLVWKFMTTYDYLNCIENIQQHSE